MTNPANEIIKGNVLVLGVKSKPFAWMHNERNDQVISAALKDNAENHSGAPGKIYAKAFSIPLYAEATEEDYRND